MRLLDTLTGQFIEHHPKYLRARYAILSHTWDHEGEQSYQELKEIQRRYVSDNERPQHEDTLLSKHEPYVAADLGWEMSPEAPMSTLTTLSESSSPPIHSQDDAISEEQNSPSENLSMPSNEALPRAPTVSWRRFLLGFHILRFTKRLAKNYRRTSATSSPSSSPSVTGQPSTQLNTPPSPTPQVELDPPPTYSPVPSSGNPSGPTGSSRCIWDDPALSPKIRDACAVARADGYRYIWIDSCCIDKSSSAELSEAINSMYRWYAHAALCYAFLADVPPKADPALPGSRFRRSRWFTRGWTLQELVAPLRVVFLARDWRAIGSKHALAALVADVTGIGYNALLHVEPLESVSVAQRLSWACGRQTTRVEDRAYALLGIFDICMPTLYGEGDRAFRRLQEEIMRRIPDQSLFAWKETYLSLPPVPLPGTVGCEGVPQPGEPTLFQCLSGSRLEGTSLLATSLSNFRQGRHIETVPHDEVFRRLQLPALPASDYDFTPHGIRTRVPVIPLSAYLLPGAVAECPDNGDVSLAQCYLAILGCEQQAAPGHLLGRVCYIPPSQSGVECLYAGRMSVSPSPRGSRSPGNNNNNVFSLFPISRETLARCRPSLEIKTVYISHPDRADGALEVARWQNHTEINLVLLRATLDALRARGYTASLRGPDPVSHPTTHWLTLAHSTSTHTIVVEFEHRLTYDGRDVDVSARLKLSGPSVDDNATLVQVHEELCGAACWFFSRPWDSNDSNSVKRIELGTAGDTKFAVYLKLYFATQNHYVIEASVEALEDPSTAVPCPSRAMELS